ncbi:MAG: DNA-binding response regulator [Cyanobacteria bacterium]|jgi:DNA-binding NarL/FixJ family response regulator|nr:DNA-binding response regulator [Cyanobacteria bacterium GSL.Bin1]
MNADAPLYLVIEDHPEVAQNNCLSLQKLDEQARCVIVSNPTEALEFLTQQIPTMAVVDLQFGSVRGEQSAQDGLNLLKHIFDDYPDLNILIYTSEYSYLKSLMHSIGNHKGGFVVVNKMEPRQAFLEGAESTLKGELRVPRELRHQLNLNENDLMVLELLCKESLSDKAIAQQLKVSLKTAQNYIQHLKMKLDLDMQDKKETNTRVSLCMEAIRRKLLVL